jgi:serine/threonine-protein kinase
MPFEPGTALDRYIIQALVGTGAMGKVYRAFDTRLERAVAIKVLEPAYPVDPDPEVSDTNEIVAGALREARAAAAILHPNATAIFDADRSGETSFIVMELVPGTPLRRLIGDASAPLGTRVRWLLEIAGALAAAHRAGVVHRDVKPENVIVRDDGLVKVLDFGIARLPRNPTSGQKHATLSGGGALVGTPAYMAPEQIRGEEIDGRADQFAWGVVAYELLTGRLPWSRPGEPFIVLTSVLSEAPAPFPPEPAIPAEIEAAVQRALSKARDDRFPTMNEAAAALTPFASARSGLGPPSVPTPLTMASPAPVVMPVAVSPVPEPAVAQFSIASPEPVFSEQISPDASSISPPPPVASESGDPAGVWQRTLASGKSAPLQRVLEGAPPAPPRLAPPDFSAPVDLDAHLALLPADATCKGMFFLDLVRYGSTVIHPQELFQLAGVPERRYMIFRDYPVSEYLRLAVAVALTVHRHTPLGEGLRRIGQTVFSTVAASLVGKTLFGAFGRDLEPILLTGPRAYKLLTSFGEVTADKIAPGTFVFRARDFPVFLATFQIGVIEGVLHHTNMQGRISVALESLSAGTVELVV